MLSLSHTVFLDIVGEEEEEEKEGERKGKKEVEKEGLKQDCPCISQLRI